MYGCPRFSVKSTITNIDDDDTELVLRCNGNVFYIHIRYLPSYLTYLEALRSGEEEIDGVFEDDFYDCTPLPFKALFEKFAPAPGEQLKITLQDYLFPEFFVYELEAVDDNLVPRLAES